jgi:transcriptional regulator with XRE-family HTH domain
MSQMTLSEMCDTTSNYIGQIEMGRRIPSFEKIEKIAAALEIPSYELFKWEPKEKQKEQKPKTEEYLKKMPVSVKKEIISRFIDLLKEDIDASFDPGNY